MASHPFLRRIATLGLAPQNLAFVRGRWLSNLAPNETPASRSRTWQSIFAQDRKDISERFSEISTEECIVASTLKSPQWRRDLVELVTNNPLNLNAHYNTLTLYMRAIASSKPLRKLLCKDHEFIGLLAMRLMDGCVLATLRINNQGDSESHHQMMWSLLVAFLDLAEEDPNSWRRHISLSDQTPIFYGSGKSPEPFSLYGRLVDFTQFLRNETRRTNDPGWELTAQKISDCLPSLGYVIRPDLSETTLSRDSLDLLGGDAVYVPFTCDECFESFPTSELKRCAKCKVAWYCSVEHQRAAWKTHKAHCFKVVSASSGV